MPKQINKENLNILILELAKSNEMGLSIPDLVKKTKLNDKTLRKYITSDIAGFIEIHEGTIRHKRDYGHGKGTQYIDGYRFKSDMNTLLALFDCISDKKIIKEFMKTTYYINLIPEIKNKVKGSFKLDEYFEEYLDIYIKNSPSVAEYLLKVDFNEIIDEVKDEIVKYFVKISMGKIKYNKKITSDFFLFIVLNGLFFFDITSNFIVDPDILKSQI